jgi:uncharacterized lipoprotein
MRKVFVLLLLTALAACASNQQSGQNQNSGESKIPDDVKAAFYSEHPYAKMNNPSTQNSQQDGTVYTIPYTRSDGSTGLAIYTSMGVLRSDN